VDDLLAAAGLQKADIKRLGETMRERDLTDSEIDLFTAYRASFGRALGEVIALLHGYGVGPVTERQKTLWSTIAKLKRSSLRLTQVQDIAGCRVVVPLARAQDALMEQLTTAHPEWRVVDRRERPSHGYRAVHVVAMVGGLPVELQIRTELQHQWAELSEAWDRRFPGIKYGDGPGDLLTILDQISDGIAFAEDLEVISLDAEVARSAERQRELLRATINQASKLNFDPK